MISLNNINRSVVITVTNRILCQVENVYLTLILLRWRIWRVPNNASRWQMGFNSAFKRL